MSHNFSYDNIYRELRMIPSAIKINRLIERNYRKISSLKNRLLFLNKCKEYDIIPNHISKSIDFSNYLNISNISKNKIELIFKNTFQDILKLEVKETYRSYDKVFSKLNRLWNEFKSILRSGLYNTLIKIQMNVYQVYYSRNRQRIIN